MITGSSPTFSLCNIDFPKSVVCETLKKLRMSNILRNCAEALSVRISILMQQSYQTTLAYQMIGELQLFVLFLKRVAVTQTSRLYIDFEKVWKTREKLKN